MCELERELTTAERILIEQSNDAFAEIRKMARRVEYDKIKIIRLYESLRMCFIETLVAPREGRAIAPNTFLCQRCQHAPVRRQRRQKGEKFCHDCKEINRSEEERRGRFYCRECGETPLSKVKVAEGEMFCCYCREGRRSLKIA